MSDSEHQLHVQFAPVRNGLLADKVAIITGASLGMGGAAARVVAQAGATVVLAAGDGQALEVVARDLGDRGARALAVPTDVGDPAAFERLGGQTLESYGRLAAAFNNAGEGDRRTPLADLALEDFDRAVRVNLRGIFIAMKYEISAMLASGGGAIVNMSSTAGLSGTPGIAGYVASKHGNIGLTKVAALDYAQRNIRVNAVAPGTIFIHRLQAAGDEARAQMAQRIPMGRLGQPDEVGAVVAWLCSDDASFITGATITVDGGRLAAGA